MGAGGNALEQAEENVPVELDGLHAGRVVAGYVLVADGHHAPVSDKSSARSMNKAKQVILIYDNKIMFRDISS